jgi:LacI family transcriptional regulator
MTEARAPIGAYKPKQGSFTFLHGLAAGTELLRQSTPPTAIFAASDTLALGVIEAARRLGLSVPDDLSIVGFDNTGLSEGASPPLTTIHQPILEIGTTAVATLLRLAGGSPPPTRRVELSTHIVVRSSTVPPRPQ